MGLNLQSTISLNSANFERGMNNVAKSVSSTLKTYALGAIGIYSIEKAFFKTIETSKELINQSKRMGVTVEQIQVMKKAASGANVEMDALATTMEKLNVFRAKALGGGEGSAEALKAFKQLGVSRQSLQTSGASEILFNEIGKKLKEVNPQTIAAPLREVLGRGYGQLVPLLTKDIDALQKKMESLGMIISSKTVYELKEFDTQINSIKNILVSALAPALVRMAEFILDVFTGTGTIGKAVEGLIFKIKEIGGKTELPSYTSPTGMEFSAQERADAAAEVLQMMHDMQWTAQKTMDEVKNNSLRYQMSVTGRVGENQIFGDFKGTSPTDFLKYLGGLIQPVDEVKNKASSDAANTMDGLREAIKNFKDSYKNYLPKPLDFEKEVGANVKSKFSPANDSLIKVGNFLGASSGAINSAQALLVQHAATTAAATSASKIQLEKITMILSMMGVPSDQSQKAVGIVWPAN